MARPTHLTLCSFCGKSHTEVNRLIADFNLIVPIASLQRFKIDAEAEVRRFEARLTPVPKE